MPSVVVWNDFFFYIFLKPDSREDTKDSGKETEKQDTADDTTTDSDVKNAEISAEQRYFMFRSKGLTQREAEVARLACNRLSNREIAEQLYISETTVKKHMTHIFEKLEITSREELENITDR